LKQKTTPKEAKSDYYYKSRITSQKRELKKLLTVSDNKLLEKYDIVMINESLADATRCKHLEILLSLTRLLSKKSWNIMNQDDIDLLVSNVMGTYSADGKETNTTYDHKKILKIFFRWVKLGSRSFRDVGNPPELKNVKTKTVADKIVREELITPEDITNLLSVCNNLRDKAFLHVHYEAGTRPGEILSLKVKHVKQDKYGMIIAVDGKTGARPIRLIESVPSLSKWISDHPFKDDPESPLWINTLKSNYGTRVTHATATKILYNACKKSQINKKINLKLFRHSEATRTAAFMTEATLRKRHGWSPTSKMPAKYAHINQKDVEDSILGHYGIKQEANMVSRVPKICPVCQNPNAYDSDTCDNCSKPLDLEKAILLEEEAQKEKDSLEERVKSMEIQLKDSQKETKVLEKKYVEPEEDDQAFYKKMKEDILKEIRGEIPPKTIQDDIKEIKEYNLKKSKKK
jgi:integrase/recombinase XerD